MLHTALEGVDGRVVGWMPAHLTKADLALGTAIKSDGSLVSATDIMANDVADRLAKLGVEHHRVPQEEVRRWKQAFVAAKATAKWIGIATHAANNHPQFPVRDSEASRWKAIAAQRKKAERRAGVDGRRKRGVKQEKQVVPADKGGARHRACHGGNCWLCTTCRSRSIPWKRLATTKCSATRCKELTKLAKVDSGDAGTSHRKHAIVTSGIIHWCETCGCFAESRTNRRMKDACPGPPPAAAGNGGMRQQLMAMRAGLHPVTGMRLPAASGSTMMGSGTYSRLKLGNDGCDGFAPYEPVVFDPPVPCGESAERKRWLLRGRVLGRQYREAAKLKRLRRKRAKEEVREVIRSFIDGSCEEEPVHEVSNDDSGEDCWLTLPTTDSRTNHIQSMPSQPIRNFPGRAMRSRMDALEVGC